MSSLYYITRYSTTIGRSTLLPTWSSHPRHTYVTLVPQLWIRKSYSAWMSLTKIILKLYVCKTELGNYNKQIKFRQLQLSKDGD